MGQSPLSSLAFRPFLRGRSPVALLSTSSFREFAPLCLLGGAAGGGFLMLQQPPSSIPRLLQKMAPKVSKSKVPRRGEERQQQQQQQQQQQYWYQYQKLREGIIRRLALLPRKEAKQKGRQRDTKSMIERASRSNWGRERTDTDWWWVPLKLLMSPSTRFVLTETNSCSSSAPSSQSFHELVDTDVDGQTFSFSSLSGRVVYHI